MVELTKVRAPCSTQDVYGPAIKAEIYDAQVKAGDIASLHWVMSGFYAAVVEPGMIALGDTIELVSELA